MFTLPAISRSKDSWLAALAAVLALGYLIYSVSQFGKSIAPHLDIATFYAAAQAVFRDGVSPYTPDVLQNYKTGSLVVIYPFVYPPPALFLFKPLIAFDLPTAIKLSYGLNIVLLTLLISGLVVWMKKLSGSTLAALLLLPLLFAMREGLFSTLWYGQIDALVALLLAGVFYGLTKNKPIFTGILLALVITLKIYPAVLLLLLLMRRNYAALMACAITGALLCAYTYFALPHYLWPAWFNHVVMHGYGAQPDGLISAAHRGNLSLNGLLMRTLEDNPFWHSYINTPRLVAPLAYLISLGLLIFSLITIKRHPQAPILIQAGSLMWLTLLIAPLSWASHTTYLLLGLIPFLAIAWRQREWVWLGLAAFLLGYALSITQVIYTIPLWRACVPATASLILWAMMQERLRRSN